MVKNKTYCVPIRGGKWTFQDKKGHTYNIDTIVKGYNKEEIINNERLKTRAMKKLFGNRKTYNFVLKNFEFTTEEGEWGYGVEEAPKNKL
jgi:hypothetical protein